MIPRTDNTDAIPIFHYVSVILALYVTAIAIPAILNLKNKKLGLASTITQIIILMLSISGIPLGIWGIVLLVKSNKQPNKRIEIDAEDAGASPASHS